jgi:hypothetical protein
MALSGQRKSEHSISFLLDPANEQYFQRVRAAAIRCRYLPFGFEREFVQDAKDLSVRSARQWP